NVRMLQLLWKGQRCPWASECIPSKLHFFLQNTKKGPGCPLEHTHTHTHTHTQTHTYTHTHTHTHMSVLVTETQRIVHMLQLCWDEWSYFTAKKKHFLDSKLLS